MNLKIAHTKNLRWIDIVNPEQKELNYLKENFKFHPLDYQDMLNMAERAKIEDRGDYTWVIMLFPVFNKTTREIRPAQVVFFAGKDYLITVHDGSMYTLINTFNGVREHAELRNLYMEKNTGFLLYQILESLLKRSFPILDHINKDISGIEKRIFTDLSIDMLKKIALMKKNIIDFRRINKTHHIVFEKLMRKKHPYLGFSSSPQYYNNLMEHNQNVWDMLVLQKETIDSLQDAHQTLATNNLNQVTKLITILSGIFLPATLIIFIFGLNLEGLPLRGTPNAFWIVLGMAAASSLAVVAYFKSKKWF